MEASARKLVAVGAVPPGKALSRVFDNDVVIFGSVEYDTLREALDDMGPLLADTGGRRVIMNYKEPDESVLHVYELKRVASWPRQEPIPFSIWNPLSWL